MIDEPADVDLEKAGAERLGSFRPQDRRPTAALLAAGGVVVLVLALAAGYLYLRRSPATRPVAADAKKSSGAQSARQGDSGEQIPLPPLDQTDVLVRQLVGHLSSHPAVAAWLTTDGLIQNFVVVTARIANGETPAGELKTIGPVPPFKTRKSRDLLYIDPASYRRYDRFGEAVSSLDARGTARLYATLKPRVRDAYRRLGGSDDDFDPVLEHGIVELLRVPVVEGDVALEPKGIGYAFGDSRLERMSKAQKQLLRMGPQNVRAVQAKLREIAPYLGIAESRLPPAH